MNITELKELAEKAAGWKLDATMQTDDDRDEGIAFVGAINDEGIFSDVARIDTGLYYQPDKAIEVAKFYAAANPAAILELIAQLEDAQGEIRALRATEAGLRDRLAQVEAEHAALLKAISDAEPVAWLVCSVNKDKSLSLEHAASWKEAAHEHINDAINEYGVEDAASWVVREVYTLNGIKKP